MNYSKIKRNKNGTIFVYIISVLFVFISYLASLSMHRDRTAQQQSRFEYYAEKGDVYSEHVIRNTIKMRLLEHNEKGPFLLKGYRGKQSPTLHYTSGDTGEIYFSNVGIQSVLITYIARVLNFDTSDKLDYYFTSIRLFNALLLSIFLSMFCFLFAKKNKLTTQFLIPWLLSGLTGFILFAQNLYYIPALVIAPGLIVAIQLSRQKKYPVLGVLILTVLNFLRGYEFLTIIALFIVFSTFIFSRQTQQLEKIYLFKMSLKLFFLLSLSFFIAITIHACIIHDAFDLSYARSFYTVFERAQIRNLSMDSVPIPFTLDFFKNIYSRLMAPGLFNIKELIIIMLVMCSFISKSLIKKAIVLYALLGYLSWYVFAYQHIMFHGFYDVYIFSLTMGLSFCLLIMLYIDKLVKLLLNKFEFGHSVLHFFNISSILLLLLYGLYLSYEVSSGPLVINEMESREFLPLKDKVK